jgi:tetratricopeptide (TPR) repeat protein
MPEEEDRNNALPFTLSRAPWHSCERSHEAFACQLARERSEAVGIVGRLLRETAREHIPTLCDHPELRTFGAHERLISIASAELMSDPQYALVLAQLAVSLSERLPIDVYYYITRIQARAYAWTEMGKTLSFLGRKEEAVEALETARAEVEEHAVLVHERAVIRLNLSLVYQEMGRYDEVRSTLVECKAVFRSFSDFRLYVLAASHEGLLLQRLRLYREAREAYLLLLTSNAQIEIDDWAALHHAIGFCSIELEENEVAEEHLTEAVALHQRLRRPLEVTKCEQGLGRLLIRRGSYHDGIALLRSVRHKLLMHSLAEEAGLCGLDIVGGMILAGEPERAEPLARTIMNEFLAAGLDFRAVAALGYLSEAIAIRRASAEMANDIREFVKELIG